MPVIHSDVEIGTPARIITDIARRDEADLIVIGTKGQHNVLERVFGSVATAVIESAPCHIWVVPEQAPFENIDIIAYASDLQEADPYHIWELGKMLEPFNPVIYCVHVNVDESVDGAMDFATLGSFFEHHAPALQISFHPLSGKSVEKALEEFVENHDVDVLAMYTSHHSLLDRIFQKSHTKRMAYETHVPLLIIKK